MDGVSLHPHLSRVSSYLSVQLGVGGNPLHQVYGLEWRGSEIARVCETESEKECMRVDEKKENFYIN